MRRLVDGSGGAARNRSAKRALYTCAQLLFLLAAVLPSTGCVAAGFLLKSSPGAEAKTEGSLAQVADRAEAVMGVMGILKQAESTEDEGDKHVLKGRRGDVDVTIVIERESESTAKVAVTVRGWDNDYAKLVLNRIVQKG
jgi:hypothetical protein